MTTGADVQATFVATIVDEWVRAGVTDAVVAPGSRSTPLLDTLAADGRIRTHVVLDERSGGFVALGIGVATGRPAPVVTTSGTAAVELHPAVVEAHQAGVPLLAVTADRPSELHHVAAPQTAEQVGLYGSAPRWAVSVGVADLASASSWRPIGARSVADTITHPSGPGPVHLNIELREPLMGTAGELPPARPDDAPWHRVMPGAGAAPDTGIVDLIAGAAGRRGLIVAGEGAPDPDDVIAMAETLGWPVIADPRSGCRVPHPLVIAAADGLLRVAAIASRHPEIVVRLGRPLASKVLAQWLGHLPEAVTQVLVDPTGAWADPERQVGVVARSDPLQLCRAVIAGVGPGRVAGEGAAPFGVWSAGWSRAEAMAQGAIDDQLGREAAPTEAAVARAVVAAVPAGTTLMASSSMPVRDVEWWGAPRRGLRVVANRGVNGIDGIVSTAMGVSIGASGPTIALAGDLAFLYDAGALVAAAEVQGPLLLVVVDNHGGGIFSFLPQAEAMPAGRFERFLGAPHHVDIVALAAAYGVAAHRVDDIGELRAACASAPPGISVVVVETDRHDNVAAHRRLSDAVAAVVASGLDPPVTP